MSRRDPPIGEQLADCVRDLRRSGMKDREIAKAADVAPSTVCRIGQGCSAVPSYTTASRLFGLRDRVIKR